MEEIKDDDDFLHFRNRAVCYIMDHPDIDDGFDLKLALWLGDKLYRNYKEYKRTRFGEGSPREIQIHHLLKSWKAFEGYNANVASFIKCIQDQDGTKWLVERLAMEFQDSDQVCTRTEVSVNKFDDSKDKKCALWSTVLAIQSACREKFNVELKMDHLKKQLKKVRLNKLKDAAEFHPLHFDNIPLKAIEDVSGDNFYTFRIRVEETNFEEELKREKDHDIYIIHEKEKKHRVLLVIHFCKDENNELCICADKRAMDKHAYNDYPRIKKNAKHCLYKIIVSDFPN